MTTTETDQTHATFVVERDYPAPVEQVWAAFADPAVKARWFGVSDEFDDIEAVEEFRVGGRTIHNGRHIATGARSRMGGTYTDIVEHARIVFVYDMWLDDAHASTSLTTITFAPSGAGTRLIYTEQGVHLDGIHGPGPDAAAGRERGTAEMLDSIAAIL
ncbi:MAG: SRPBCC domain-containing protein [Patulibacter sp.]